MGHLLLIGAGDGVSHFGFGGEDWFERGVEEEGEIVNGGGRGFGGGEAPNGGGGIKPLFVRLRQY